MVELVGVRKQSGVVVCESCAVADRPLARMRGLLGRKSLAPGEGLLLTPERSIHMWFMRFPIDAVFLDRDLSVVSVREGLRPWRMASCRVARSVLELPAGTCRRHAIRPGDRLSLTEAGDARAQVLLLVDGGG